MGVTQADYPHDVTPHYLVGQLLTGVVHPPDRQRITCFRDGSLRLWDQESGALIGDNWRDDKYDEEVWTMALSPDAARQLPLEAGTGL